MDPVWIRPDPSNPRDLVDWLGVVQKVITFLNSKKFINQMRIRIIHWKVDEIKMEIERLRQAGHLVDTGMSDGQKLLRSISQKIPEVILIDLSRLPSQGRDLAIYLRKTKATRFIPLIFIDGTDEKLAKIRTILPDVLHSDWQKIDSVLNDAISAPLTDVHVPQSVFEAYKDKDLYKKLGISENMHVDFINSPDNLFEKLEPLPTNVTIGKTLSSGSNLLLWFVQTQSELKKEINKIRTGIKNRSVWIIWPKKSGNIVSDLTQQAVRQSGLDAGLVDFKICSLDQNWSGLLFRCRKKSVKND